MHRLRLLEALVALTPTERISAIEVTGMGEVQEGTLIERLKAAEIHILLKDADYLTKEGSAPSAER